jgi:hypothetical protein
MYRSGLVGKRMALFGLVGGPLLVAAAVAVLLGVIPQGSALQGIATAPEFIWELFLGLYLTFKGFKSSPLLAPKAGSWGSRQPRMIRARSAIAWALVRRLARRSRACRSSSVSDSSAFGRPRWRPCELVTMRGGCHFYHELATQYTSAIYSNPNSRRNARVRRAIGNGDSGHGILNAGGHLPERRRPRKLPVRGHEICTPSR